MVAGWSWWLVLGSLSEPTAEHADSGAIVGICAKKNVALSLFFAFSASERYMGERGGGCAISINIKFHLSLDHTVVFPASISAL